MEDERGFAYAGFAADEGEGAGDESAAEDAIELGGGHGDAWLVEGLYFGYFLWGGLGVRARGGCFGGFGGEAFFDHCVPFAT